MKINIEPWPATYETIKEGLEAKKLVPNTEGRTAGAMRCAIPPLTVEPPQIHLIAKRDSMPFQELITDFDGRISVGYFNLKTGKTEIRTYSPGQDIYIPLYVPHWLANFNNEKVIFTCEFAPDPWDDMGDEPEFPNLTDLLRFVNKEGLRQKVLDAC